MKRAYQKLRTNIETVAGKYTNAPKRKELDQILLTIENELKSQHISGQRIMPLLRLLMTKQPGSSKFVNEFLRDPEIAGSLHHGGFTMD